MRDLEASGAAGAEFASEVNLVLTARNLCSSDRVTFELIFVLYGGIPFKKIGGVVL